MALLPDYGGGIEYPSMIFEATPSRSVLVHEVAHMWFYGMVGNSQFRDPWLDEAFASWAEAVVDGGRGLVDQAAALDARRRSAARWPTSPTTARTSPSSTARAGPRCSPRAKAAGPEAFDAAIRCYVDANAWSIATPDDVGAALADLPGGAGRR